MKKQIFKIFITSIRRYVALLLLGFLALQLYFFLQISLFTFINPVSTTFERSEALRIGKASFTSSHNGIFFRLPWLQEWRPNSLLSNNIKRAVIFLKTTFLLPTTGFSGRRLRELGQITPKPMKLLS